MEMEHSSMEMLSTDNNFCSLNFTLELRYDEITIYGKSKNYSHERSTSWTSSGTSFPKK